jgi:hypothetical protein
MKKQILTISFAMGTLALFAQAGIITTIAGTGTATFSGDGGQATAAALNHPYRTAFDMSGNLFIADNSNNCIRQINSSGVITTFAGTTVFGFSGDGGLASSARLYTPTSVMPDAAGNVYIVDEDNMRIRKVNASGIISTVVANGTYGFLGDGGPAASAELKRPYGIAADAAGNLYIADTENHRIRKVNTSGIISTVAGNGTAGFSGDGALATAAALNNPRDVAVDAAGNIYIADTYNSRMRKVTAATGIITTIAGTGLNAFSGDGGLATSASLNYPSGLALAGGSICIADEGNNRVRLINASGIISTVAGNGTAGFSGDGSLATSGKLNSPVGVSFDNTGNLYIADLSNNRIRKVTNVVVGVQQYVGNSEQIKLYPNPAKDILTIELGNSSEKSEIKISDVLGNEVKNVDLSMHNGTAQINSDNLNNGIYFVTVLSNGISTTKKIIVNK